MQDAMSQDRPNPFPSASKRHTCRAVAAKLAEFFRSRPQVPTHRLKSATTGLPRNEGIG